MKTNRQQRRAAKQRKLGPPVPHEEAHMKFVAEDGDLVLYVIVGGVRIAKRYSGKNWIALEPGYTVRGSEPGGDYGIIEVEYTSVAAQLQ
jgi:hypothetical protein